MKISLFLHKFIVNNFLTKIIVSFNEKGVCLVFVWLYNSCSKNIIWNYDYNHIRSEKLKSTLAFCMNIQILVRDLLQASCLSYAWFKSFSSLFRIQAELFSLKILEIGLAQEEKATSSSKNIKYEDIDCKKLKKKV